jgi:hypothetical protein
MQHVIEQSIRENRIVTIDNDSTAMDMLAASCEDCVVNGEVTEYWGTTPEGREWRVHVRNEVL